MTVDYIYPADEYLLLGKVAKPQGLQGDLKIFLHSGQPENVALYKELRLVDRDGVISPPLAVLASRVHGKAAIVRLASITTRTEAEQVEGQGVLLARHHLPTVGENEYYWHQYQDKLVVDIAGNEIGRVARLFNTGAQDVLVVQAGKEEVLIPVTKEILVGETADNLIVDLPPGLIGLNATPGN